MDDRGGWRARLALAAGIVWAIWAPRFACAHEPASSAQAPLASQAPALALAQRVPLEQIAPGMRELVQPILEQPTLTARGPIEIFRGRPALYHWLLNHPDRAVIFWRKLGAKCMGISDRGAGRFGWKDNQGSDITWITVYDSATLRVWYADGIASPGALLPNVPVRAVVVLHHAETIDPLGRTVIHHQADLYVQTDSKTASTVTRLLGPAAPRLARQCLAQLELFFSGLVWYLEKHPERAETLLMGNLPPGSPAASELRQLLTEAGIHGPVKETPRAE